MKAIQFVLPFLVLLALTFALAGCPKKMMGDATPPVTVEQIG